MFADREILQYFPFILRCSGTRLFLARTPAPAAKHAFLHLVETRRREKLERVSAPLKGLENEVFAKSQPLDSLKPKLRATFWRPKRNGMFDWPLEEVINTLEAQRRGAPVANLAGFGYSKSAVGITQEFFIFTDLLGSHVNGMEWLQCSGNDIEDLIRLSFRLLRLLHDKSVIHMDFWVNNVMVNLHPAEQPKAIDLENCFLTHSQYACEVLGFQFGFFYRREIYRFLTEARYDQLVYSELAEHYGVDRERFKKIYSVSKHEVISRRARREIFRKGTVVTG